MERSSVFSKHNIILIMIPLYLFCAMLYATTPYYEPEVTGFTTFLGETGMDILICVFCLALYSKEQGEERRLLRITGWAFFCEAFADGFYNLIQNILNISNPSIFIASLYEIPLLFFLGLQTWLWWKLFAQTIAKKDKKIISIYTPFIASSLLAITIFVYLADWKIQRFSSEGLYQLADILIEATGFTLASICLSISCNKSFSFIAVGFLVIVFANYMIRLPVLSLATMQNNPFEFLWIIGQLLIFYGLTRLSLNRSKNWCYKINSLQSQIAASGFGLGLLTVMLFSIFVKYATNSSFCSNDNILKYLLPMMIILSIISVILSSFFSKKILAPLKELEKTIEFYSTHPEHVTKLDFHDDYGIEEYIELKAFIKKGLFSLSQKLTIERETSCLAARISHDIASPLSVMNIVLQTYNELLPANAQSLMKNAIQRMYDISNTLLKKYKNTGEDFIAAQGAYEKKQAQCYVRLEQLIECILQQKQIEWSSNPCEIVFKNNVNVHNNWIFIDPENLKRIISNLLNNSYEALQIKNQIEIIISIENNFLNILISDSGCGIAQKNLSAVLRGKSLRSNGNGLGLSSAHAYMESIGGKLLLTSSENHGTQVKIFFPHVLAPSWFRTNIPVYKNSSIIILDDDLSITCFWNNHLRNFPGNIFAFNRADEFLSWHAKNHMNLAHSIYLFDYHLQDSLWTGLALLEKLQIKENGYLVTSIYDNPSIQQHCTRLNVWLIPKILIQEIVFEFNNHFTTPVERRDLI